MQNALGRGCPQLGVRDACVQGARGSPWGTQRVLCQPAGTFPSCRAQVARVCKIGTNNGFVKLSGRRMLGTVGRSRKKREYLSKCGLLRRGVSEQQFPLSAWSLGRATAPWGARRALAAGFLCCALLRAPAAPAHAAATKRLPWPDGESSPGSWGDEPSSGASGCSAGAQSRPRAGGGVGGTVRLPVDSRG